MPTLIEKIKNRFSLKSPKEPEKPIVEELTLEECREKTLILLDNLCKAASSKAKEPHDAWHILHTEAFNCFILIKEKEAFAPLIITSMAKIVDLMDCIVQTNNSEKLCHDFYKELLTLTTAFSPIGKRLMEIHDNNK